MASVRKLVWLFLCGLSIAAGACIAIAATSIWLERYSENQQRSALREKPEGRVEPDKNEIVFKDVAWLELTRGGGVSGFVQNNSKNRISHINANLRFMRGAKLLHSCNDHIDIKLEPGSSSRFQMLCQEVDRTRIGTDVVPEVEVQWVSSI